MSGGTDGTVFLRPAHVRQPDGVSTADPWGRAGTWGAESGPSPLLLAPTARAGPRHSYWPACLLADTAWLGPLTHSLGDGR